MKNSTSCFFTVLFLTFSFSLTAQVPEGYYSSARGKQGAALKTALFEIIREPDVVTYAQLWKAFEKTDALRNNKVWDMYSDNPEEEALYHYDFRNNRCGSSKAEGECFNREHSLPRSWFKGTKLLETDLFHLYPTDGYVNNRRSNLPFGEAGIVYWRSTNGSKVGQNTFGSYTKTIFEPIDAYKGDFARTYFYVVTAYEDKVHQWRSDQIGRSSYPGFSDWSLLLLLKWHRDDPVSLKEVRRNEEVYKLQKNRNPFIDYPELVEQVWGKTMNSQFEPEVLSDSFLEIECSPFERWLKGVGNLFKQR
jgi:endonuclease I